MLKFQDVFRSKDTPYMFVVGEIKPSVKTKFGEKAIAQMIYNGAEYDWWLDPKKLKDFALQSGETVEVMQSQAPGAQYPSYAVARTLKASDAPRTGFGVLAPVDDYQKQKEILQNRISIAGYLQALISSGKHDLEACKSLAIELVEWSKAESEKMYESDHVSI